MAEVEVHGVRRVDERDRHAVEAERLGDEFLRLVEETGSLPAESGRAIHVVDFGCGNAYLTFALDYTSRHKRVVKSPDWRPGEDLLQEFRDWVVQEKIATAKEMDEAMAKPEIRDFASLQIRAEVMNSLFGQEARHRTLSEGDKQLQAALNLFGQAATMMAQRQELGAPNPRIPRTDESPKGRL